jgi:hypothetical protein
VNPAALPLGSLPALPYVDVAAKRIVDGTRRVDLSGMQGDVLRLYKVDGGHVVGRVVGGRPGLVFVSSGGTRFWITW